MKISKLGLITDLREEMPIYQHDTPNLTFQLLDDKKRENNPPYNLTGVDGVRLSVKQKIGDTTLLWDPPIDGVVEDAENGIVSFQLEETHTATPYNQLLGEIKVDIGTTPNRRLTVERFYFAIYKVVIEPTP